MKKHLFFLAMGTLCLGGISCEAQRSSATTAPEMTASAVPAASETRPSEEEVSIEAVDPGASASEAIRQIQSTPYTDANFVALAAEMGMAEVKLGRLAEKKAVNPAVKDYGVEMQEEHNRANSLLMHLAKENKWVTPEQLNAEHEDAYTDLVRVMSDEFDRRYMQQMVRDHEVAVALFSQAAQKASNAELRNYAKQTEPALREHLNTAQEIMQKLNTKK